MNQPFPLLTVDVSGDPEQLGAGYGEQARRLIRDNVDLYLARFASAAGLDRAAVVTAGAGFRTTTAQHFPRIARMLDATALAAGVEPELIYAVNARSELLYASPSCGAPVGDGGECTSLGVLDTHSADGHTLLAQNWDWHPDHRPYSVLLITRDERGHGVAALTEAGMLAKAGVNSAGVGVAVNLLTTERDGRPGGVPYHVVLRSVLEADSLSWAIRNVVRAPRSASINLLIGQAGPGGGELIDLELVPGDAGWLHPVDGVLTHANHLETTLPVYDTIKDWGGSSLFRSARARRLLTASGKPITLEHVRDVVLSDHHSFPLAICRHVDERDNTADHSETIWTVLIDLNARSMELIPGPPCNAKETLSTSI
jgi:isopenicillin-N N-acyltransferase like protein